ncbi:MAG: RagB/SusD family nutrient uptake outer membrane protein [Bacteroidales bacterium]|nr:RagB/SusD family nutrient uptake outer membrane protein [Bacteroidales bacterium]
MKRYILPAIALVIGLTSCSDFLNRTPKSDMAPENYFRDETDLQLFSNTFYNNLLDKEPYEEQSDQLVCLNLSTFLRGGNSRTVPNSGGGWGSGSGAWGDLRKMNTLLENVDKCTDAAAVAKYSGLTRFFRAYFYFNMVKRFGDVPWINAQLETDSEDLYRPRDSREVILGHMLEDIDFAIDNLPAEVSPYRVNRWTALALKARFCLFEGTFRKYHDPAQHPDMYVVPLPSDARSAQQYLQLAADAARELIDDGPYKLAGVKDYRTLFADVDANRDEFILAIKNDQSLQVCNNATAFAMMTTQGTPGFTRKFVASVLMADGSRFTDREGWETMQFAEEMKDRDPRLAAITVGTGAIWLGDETVSAPDLNCTVTGYQVMKFVMDKTLPEWGRVDKSYNDMPVFRYAEVLLNYAEAKAELGTLTQEDADLTVNALRARVGMAGRLDVADANAHPDPYLLSEEFGYRNVSGTNQGVILEIRRERALELAMEGFRLADLLRWREGKCLEQPIYGMYFPGTGRYDLSGDNVADINIWTGTDPKSKDVSDFELGVPTGIELTDGDKGYVYHHANVTRSFDEGRDYYYPIPTKERQLYHEKGVDLKQNPGWKDGLSY